MTREEKRAFWQHHMTQWENSSQSQSAYCTVHDLKLATFGYWRTQWCRQRLADSATQGNAVAFVAVRPAHSPGLCADEAQLDLGVASIRLPARYLSELLPLLWSLPMPAGTR